MYLLIYDLYVKVKYLKNQRIPFLCQRSLIAVKVYQIITTCECDVLKSFSLTLTMTVSQGHVSKVMEFMNLAIAQSYQ